MSYQIFTCFRYSDSKERLDCMSNKKDLDRSKEVRRVGRRVVIGMQGEVQGWRSEVILSKIIESSRPA